LLSEEHVTLYVLPLASVTICPFAWGQRLAEELLDAAADDDATVVDETVLEVAELEVAELDEADETELEVDCFKNPAT
jgi:hypothetical protein